MKINQILSKEENINFEPEQTCLPDKLTSENVSKENLFSSNKPILSSLNVDSTNSNSNEIISNANNEQYHEKLLRMVKKEVKQIMEEAVTRKFVHEDSSSIISLCTAIDSCLSYGLKRRALGLFKTNSTIALLQKMAKNCEAAAIVYKILVEFEKITQKSSSSSDSINKFRLSLTKKKCQNNTNNKKNVQNVGTNPLINRTQRYLWVRIALLEKQLYKIIEHLVCNSSVYYEKEALISDVVNGQILASLLIGPCTLNYSKVKCQDHNLIDPSANELIQRHNLINTSSTSSPVFSFNNKAPLHLPYLKWFNNSLTESSSNSNDSKTEQSSNEESPVVHCSLTQRLSLNSPFSPKEYIESLHQNYKSTLLYGKNNVFVQPKGDVETLPGYLSLHQNLNNLEIKWTPNQLMKRSNSETDTDISTFWNYALSINIEDIVYLHCHHSDQGSLAVFIGYDGVQQPPIRFPRGSHLLSFLTCLEAGLLPDGQLDPPLGLHNNKGKVFPQLKRRNKNLKKKKTKLNQDQENDEDKNDEMCDFVFRILTSLDKPDSISEEMFNPKVSKNAPLWKPKNKFREKLVSTSSNSSSNSSQSTIDNFNSSQESTLLFNVNKNSIKDNSSIQSLCEIMKRKIVSRAFYGWLGYCRHLKTVRTHLSALVNPDIIEDKNNFSSGLTIEKWNELHDKNGCIKDSNLMLKLIYFGYCDPSIRIQVWPYLLGHYDFNSTFIERKEQDEKMNQNYELLMTEWLAVEAIVKQRDKENLAANLAKFNSQQQKAKEIKNFTLNQKKNENYCSKLNGKLIDSNENSLIQNLDLNKNEKEQVNVNNLLNPYSIKKILIKNTSVDLVQSISTEPRNYSKDYLEKNINECKNEDQLSADHSACVSPASSNGGIYTNEILDKFSLNMHRIDKDVQRCDRNYNYFASTKNLEKLRNIMCTYVWQNLQNGYVQGMCDLVAPLLVIFNDEILSYSCFCELMKRMSANFPYGGAIDIHFANMHSMIKILDPELFELMHSNNDYTHFYFCYRWFLLDFKREFNYDDIFKVWEVIWSGKTVASSNMVLFIALALIQQYREIILENEMDFTDIIKFFNEMAERHDVNLIMESARKLVFQIQTLIN